MNPHARASTDARVEVAQCVQWFDPAMLSEGDPRLDIGFCGVPQ
jgi:hypothetical protein